MISGYWDIILGDGRHPGYDVEIISGVKDSIAIDNVGVKAA